MRSINKTLLVRASGGLSNRLQAVICGIAYCLLTKRAICVDWRDGLYSDDFSNVFPLWFEIKGLENIGFEQLLSSRQAKTSINPIFWEQWLNDAVAVEYLFSNNDHTLAENRLKTSIDLTNTELDDEILVYWGWTIDSMMPLIPMLKAQFPCMANIADHKIPQHLINTYLGINPKIEQEVQAFWDKHFTKSPVGIHIRHTDLKSPLPQLLQKLDDIASDSDEIFLCTDNELIEKMVRRLFPQTITNTKIYQGVNIPLHSYVEGISNVQKGREAVIDMLLLARCKHIIHFTQSSFARISTLVSNIDQSCIHKVAF